MTLFAFRGVKSHGWTFYDPIMDDATLKERSETIAGFPIFSGLSEDHLIMLARMARPRRVKRKEMLFREGEPALGFFLLVKGKIKLIKISQDGKEQILHFVLSGSSFAEAAIYIDRKYPAFAEALEDSELLFIPNDEFTKLLGSVSDLAANLVAHLAHYLHMLTRKVEELSLMDATSRLCRLLAENMDRETGTVELPVGKGQTATSLGMAVETFSRTLRRLKDDGIVEETSQGVLRVLDVEALERFAL
jgi:CRP/FNR family transcriptional regulator